MKKTHDEVIIMRNRFLAFTTVFSLLFGMSCFNCDFDLTAIAVTENDDAATTTTTTTAHVHNWVDITETKTIHHDAEYATRTYWTNGTWLHGCSALPIEDIINTPGRYGDWMNTYTDAHGDWGRSLTLFDFILLEYGNNSNNWPSWITYYHSEDELNNAYGCDVVDFTDVDPYTWHRLPKFNPDTDLIVTFDYLDFINDCWQYGVDNYGLNTRTWEYQESVTDSMNEVYPVFQEQIKVKDAWDETTTVVVGHKCTSCGATK